MQIIADQLGLNVKIDTDFIEDAANDDLIMLIASGLFTLTRKNLLIPYKNKEDGLIAMIVYTENDTHVFRDHIYNDD